MYWKFLIITLLLILLYTDFIFLYLKGIFCRKKKKNEESNSTISPNNKAKNTFGCT